MTKLRQTIGIALILASSVTFSGCKHHYKGYYWDHWKPSFRGHSNSGSSSTSTTSSPQYYSAPQAAQPAPWEANLRAVQQQQYKNDMYNYQHGYTNKLPGIP